MYGKGQDLSLASAIYQLSLASAIYQLMFTVYGLSQQEFILDYLDRLNSDSCLVSSMFSDTPESPYRKEKV